MQPAIALQIPGSKALMYHESVGAVSDFSIQIPKGVGRGSRTLLTLRAHLLEFGFLKHDSHLGQDPGWIEARLREVLGPSASYALRGPLFDSVLPSLDGGGLVYAVLADVSGLKMDHRRLQWTKWRFLQFFTNNLLSKTEKARKKNLQDLQSFLAVHRPWARLIAVAGSKKREPGKTGAQRITQVALIGVA